jgi:hypothetical protein
MDKVEGPEDGGNGDQCPMQQLRQFGNKLPLLMHSGARLYLDHSGCATHFQWIV